MANLEAVCEARTWRDGTLMHLASSIHTVGSLLHQTVEMETGGLVPQFIVDVDDDMIPDIGFESGTWPLAVDAYDRPHLGAIRVGINPCDVPVIGDGCCQGHVQKSEGEDESEHGERMSKRRNPHKE